MVNELPFDEVVDTACDILEMANSVAKALEDGIDLTDIGVLFSVAPKIAEVMRDRQSALDQLLDLTPEEAEQAAQQIGRRMGVPSNYIVARVVEVFPLLSRTYGQAKQVQYLATDWARWARSFNRPKEDSFVAQY